MLQLQTNVTSGHLGSPRVGGSVGARKGPDSHTAKESVKESARNNTADLSAGEAATRAQ